MSKISIALCTYNGAKFLREQLESYVIQTRLPDELIIGEDCSTDETVEIINEFKETAPFPVKLHINSENLGSTKNFEETIQRCTGDIIFLSDQDDIWLPEKISVLEKSLAENPDVGLVFSDAELIDDQGKLLKTNLWDFTFTKIDQESVRSGNSLEVLLRHNVVTGAASAFRSDLIPLFTPIETKIADVIHDGWIALLCSVHSKLKFVDKRLIHYRQHENQQLGVNWETKRNAGSLLSKFSRKYEDRNSKLEKSIKYIRTEITRVEETIETLKANELLKDSSVLLDKEKEKSIKEKQNQIGHLEARMSLPNNRLKRIYPIIKEIRTKRYYLFSRGLYGIGRDFFEKWN